MLTIAAPTAYQFHRPPADIPQQASIPMDLHLKGKRVLSTGASKGIGAAAAEAFAEEGCHVRLAARNAEAMEALAKRLRAEHKVEVSVHSADLRKPDDLANLAKDAADIDILVNN